MSATESAHETGRFLCRYYCSYFVLWILSLCCYDYMGLQRLLALSWLMLMYWDWGTALRHMGKLRFLATVLWTQLPTVALSLWSFWLAWHRAYGEWANGALELWVHPVLPLLEWLPETVWGGWSSTYLFSCGLPALFAVGGTIYWVSLKFMRKVVRRGVNEAGR